jgi:hypothetical protein
VERAAPSSTSPRFWPSKEASASLLHRIQARCRRPHQALGQRMGGARRQRERHRAWLHRHQQH